MLSKYVLFIVLYFAFTKSFAQASDGMRLNVRLYPVQMLAIDTGFSDDGRNEYSSREFQSVLISSPSGFELKAHYEEFPDDINMMESDMTRSDEYNLISHRKGVVQKRYKINKDIDNVIKNLGSSIANEPNFLILTLISQ
ncbi:MAG: hypothetical protein MUW56_03060 [Chryseobacterium sp.]|uniref:hypothetical protein n=1 Tax=Chryseobacterium sp. TaxID=1871047 RepID=UPI0025BC5289|nr:hypothetical protein [Chryseobacterium sp.]MCJ7932626.1 hypothetical protein [Chryseobacterium sp.]